VESRKRDQAVQPKTVDVAEIVETQEKGWFPLSIFLMCCLVMLVDGFNQQSLNYAAPAIIKDWGINRAMMTPVFDINIFGWMLGAIGFSMLADRIGRRNSILLAVFERMLFRMISQDLKRDGPKPMTGHAWECVQFGLQKHLDPNRPDRCSSGSLRNLPRYCEPRGQTRPESVSRVRTGRHEIAEGPLFAVW